MPSVSRLNDSVMSVDGSGYKCYFPTQTSVGEANNKSVLANGIPIVVIGNQVAPHALGGCGPDTSTLTDASSKVFIGGKGVGRIGDTYGGGINIITQGSSNVFSG